MTSEEDANRVESFGAQMLVGLAAPNWTGFKVHNGEITPISWEKLPASKPYIMLLFIAQAFVPESVELLIALSSLLVTQGKVQSYCSSTDTPEAQKFFAETLIANGGIAPLSLPFPSDPSRIFHRRFGVLKPDGTCLNGMVIINEDGIVARSCSSLKQFTADQVIITLQAVQC